PNVRAEELWEEFAAHLGHASSQTPLSLLLPKVFMPDLRMCRDVAGEQGSTLFPVQVDHLHSQRSQPFHATLEITALAHDDRAKAKLADQSAAIPAGREGSDHDEIAIAALPPGVSESIGLAVHGWVAMLHAPVVPGSEQAAFGIEDGGANGNAAFGQPFTGF